MCLICFTPFYVLLLIVLFISNRILKLSLLSEVLGERVRQAVELLIRESAESFNALEPFQIPTSEMVLTEVLNSFSKRESAFRKAIAKFVKQSFKSPKIEVVPQNHDLFHQCLDLYEQRSDKGWSHTDCASFCIMQQRNILEALTHDRHFE
jgi:predicted nucleic acid-binding protein